MKHYAIEQWVDYSRDLGDANLRNQMQAHLEEGCEGCHRLNRLCAKLVSTCTALSSVEVPDHAIRMARAIFPVHYPSQPRRGNRIPVELIFDSFLVPSPAGLRAIWQVGWQGLYRAGECSVDLRVEPELRSARAAVIGQITNHITPTKEMGNLAVSLRAGKEVVAETMSNRFGEFQLEYEQKSRLKLCIHLPDSKMIEVPLKKLSVEQPAAKSRGSSKVR